MTNVIMQGILLGWLLTLAGTSMASADLASYVRGDDEAYRWAHLSQTDRPDGITVHELQLTSQVWQGVAWHHRLRILVPNTLPSVPSLVLLIISESGNGERELQEGIVMARAIGAPVAVLHDIPNQPLFGGLVEDDLLAHTFLKFLETRDAGWPLLLPMAKGAVKAMDAIQEFMRRDRHVPIAGFVVSGASKRGWTTWLLPAVDQRVRAIIPLVYDNLNLARQLRHQQQSWGTFSGQIREYSERGLPQRLLANEPGAVALAALVDPFTYRQDIRIPKLIILGTNDPYWPLDALNQYYKELLGETYVLYLPNAGHDLGAGRARALEGIVAMMLHMGGRLVLPKLAWKATMEADTLTLTLTSDLKPQGVRVWRAAAPTRDFRQARWEVVELREGDASYVYRQVKRPGEVVALFGEAVYARESGSFALSTTVHMLP